MDRADVVVIGAGMGGLAAAVRLQAAGVRTVLIDRNPLPGGKLNLVEERGYTFDTGPSLVTMPEVFDELFAAVGMDFRRDLELVRLDPYCRYFFDDGTVLETSDSIERMTRDLLRLAPRDVEAFFAFLGKAAQWYRMSAESVIYGPPLDWRTARQSKLDPIAFFRARPFQRLDKLLATTFTDERIRRIARLIALYTGCDPARTPAIFTLIPFLEFGLGRWYVQGGLYGIARKLIERYRALGGDYRSGRTVTRVAFENGHAVRAELDSSEVLEAATFVVNADVATAASTFLREAPGAVKMQRRLAALKPSTSAFVLLIGGRLPEAHRLVHHNILFSRDEAAEWREIFREGRPPSEPTVYLNHPSYTDPSLAPADRAALFAMINVPARTEWDWDAYEALALRTIAQRLGDVTIDVLHRRTPADFAQRTFADRGSLYGKAPESIHAMMKRPKNEEPGFDGVFFVGGTTHPGAGIPLAALSGKLVAEAILQKIRILIRNSEF